MLLTSLRKVNEEQHYIVHFAIMGIKPVRVLAMGRRDAIDSAIIEVASRDRIVISPSNVMNVIKQGVRA